MIGVMINSGIALTISAITLALAIVIWMVWPLEVLKRFLIAVLALVLSAVAALLFQVTQLYQPFSHATDILALIALFFLLLNCLVNPYSREKIYGYPFSKKRWAVLWIIFGIGCYGLIMVFFKLDNLNSKISEIIVWTAIAELPVVISMIYSTIEGFNFLSKTQDKIKQSYIKGVCVMNVIFLPLLLLEITLFTGYFLRVLPIISIFLPFYLSIVLTLILIKGSLYFLNKSKSPIYIDIQEINNNGLTDREKEIAHLIINGISNQEIADTLFISRSTVKTHVQNIFKKLNIQKRYQLLSMAFQKK